jgi:hypothetical protein
MTSNATTPWFRRMAQQITFNQKHTAKKIKIIVSFFKTHGDSFFKENMGFSKFHFESIVQKQEFFVIGGVAKAPPGF